MYAPSTYTPAAPDWAVPTGTGTVVLAGPAQYQTRTTATGPWSSTQTLAWGQAVSRAATLIRYRTGATWSPGAVEWTTSTETSDVTVTGPAVYQTRASATSTTWANPVFLAAGAQKTHQADLIRHRGAALPTAEVCTPRTTTHSEPGIDSFRQPGDEPFTFSLAAADDTPDDDTDNPVLAECTRTFTAATPFELTYLGSVRWNRLCTITPDMPSGRYVLRARNSGVAQANRDGSNQWGLVARYADAAGDGLCDGRTDPACPRVYANDDLSVSAFTPGAVASFFLAEIDGSHAGRTVEIELFDPGEGMSQIEVLRPTGPETWTAAPFTWTSTNADGSPHAGSGPAAVTSLSVTNSVFNGRLVRIRIPLDGDTAPSGHGWWKVQYTSTSGLVTDRTTWTARIVG